MNRWRVGLSILSGYAGVRNFTPLLTDEMTLHSDKLNSFSEVKHYNCILFDYIKVYRYVDYGEYYLIGLNPGIFSGWESRHRFARITKINMEYHE